MDERVTYLWEGRRGRWSRVQVMTGYGEPTAEHFRDTGEPGDTVCSMGVYRSWGAESVCARRGSSAQYLPR